MAEKQKKYDREYKIQAVKLSRGIVFHLPLVPCSAAERNGHKHGRTLF